MQAVGATYAVTNFESFFHARPDPLAQAYAMKPEDLEKQLADHSPIDHLEPLAKRRIPLLHIHGDKDTVVPLEPHAAEFIKRYKALGGPAELLVIPGKGHEEVAEYFQCQPLADFLVKHAKEPANAAP